MERGFFEVGLSFLKNMVPYLLVGLSNLQRAIRTPGVFFAELGARKELCASACLVGFVMGGMLTLLSVPALRGAGVLVGTEFLIFALVVDWMLLLLYGLCFWVGARLFRAKTDVSTALNAFFYISVYLVFMRLVEIPALGVRMHALALSCNAGEFSSSVTNAISSGSMYKTSNSLVFVFYIWFFVCSIKMQKALNGFGLIKGVLSAVVGMALLSLAVAYIQEPLIYSLVCSYVVGG